MALTQLKSSITAVQIAPHISETAPKCQENAVTSRFEFAKQLQRAYGELMFSPLGY